MTGAMYAAVAGLKTHMQKLNVIGNNVANVNTYGYKAARTTFKESLYTTVTGGSNGTAASGGINPSQIGYGCNIGTIDLDMSTKNYMPTGRQRDCMIDGNGFFIVGDKPDVTAGGSAATSGLKETDAVDLNLTRVGNFEFDSQGYLVDGYGNVVYGFVTVTNNATPGELTAAEKEDPKASTQLVPIRLPLISKTTGAPIFPGISAADTDGNRMNVYDSGTDATSLTEGKPVKLDSISIDGQTGKITGTTEGGDKIVVGYIALAKVDNPNGVTHMSGPYYRAMEGAGSCAATSINNAIAEVCIGDPNLNNRPNAAAGTNTNLPTRIESAGDTALITGGLESSGTDLATEISEMITTQRGYQANTRIITVTDSMLEELVNMKR